MIEVVIADDNIFLAEALAEKLNTFSDISVKQTFNNLNDLFNYLPDSKFNILILDINFNGISSLDYIGRIHTLKPGVKIIALTSLNNDFMKQEAINKGINYFKGKDSSIEYFDEYIRSCFNGDNGTCNKENNSYPVSYTHLTLPTILLV